jgi:hypothetical protein
MRKNNCGSEIIVSCLTLFFIFLMCACQYAARAQDRQIVIPDGPQVITDAHHLIYRVAGLLEEMYLKPVTYEDPILNWSGDIDEVPNAMGEKLRIPKRGNFTMPLEANPRKNPVLDEVLLRKIVNAYQEQTDGPRFRITISRYGFHLIADQVRDNSGQFVKAVTFLDTVISVPAGRRTPSGHVSAICDAINSSSTTGVKLLFFPQYLNGFFSQAPLSLVPSDEELEKTKFSWGIDRRIARDALADLLEQSATTMTWALLCDTEPKCGLNIFPINVNYIGRDGKQHKAALDHDRKKKSE